MANRVKVRTRSSSVYPWAPLGRLCSRRLLWYTGRLGVASFEWLLGFDRRFEATPLRDRDRTGFLVRVP